MRFSMRLFISVQAALEDDGAGSGSDQENDAPENIQNDERAGNETATRGKGARRARGGGRGNAATRGTRGRPANKKS